MKKRANITAESVNSKKLPTQTPQKSIPSIITENMVDEDDIKYAIKINIKQGRQEHRILQVLPF